jgi:tetratricopeptide (TPR) repeat protein
MAIAAAIVVGAVRPAAQADDKKPGMFDFDPWKLPVTRQRESAGRLAPKGLDLTPAAGVPSEPRPIRLRIYADQDYRGLMMRWQPKVRVQIDRLNAVVGPVFGVRFEIESFRDWDRSHVGQPFEPILKDLEALDPAREVDWVLGLTTPMRGVATSIHQIGGARLLGRHLLLRGMDDEEEFRALEDAFKLLSPDERQRLYAERKAHKEVVVFLHEWGHSVGLLHDDDHALIMNPSYDERQRTFSDFDKEVLALVIERRLARRSELYPESADLLPLYEKAPADEGSDQERAQVLALLRWRVAGGKETAAGPPASQSPASPPLASQSPASRSPASSGRPAPAPAAAELSPADTETYNRAAEAAQAGHPEEAWRLLSPLMARPRAGKPNPQLWTRLARLAAAIGALSAAESAIGQGARGDVELEKIAGDVEAARHRVALPSGGAKAGVEPDREPTYVAGFWETEGLVAAAHFDPAASRARLRDFAAAFPAAPGVELLACDLELRANHATLAAKHCETALTKAKEASRAYFLLGLIATRAHRDNVAEAHLRHAILLDPETPEAWRALAKLYRGMGAQARLAELDDKHRVLFSTPLPE